MATANSITIVVGTVLSLLVAFVIALIILLDSGHCSAGTFACKNSSTCVPQKSMCDGHQDCPHGEDESAATCADFHGSSYILDLIRKSEAAGNLNQADYEKCDLMHVPKGCKCQRSTFLYCKNLGLTRVPADDVDTRVTRLILANNSINNLSNNSFGNYPNLELLHLEGNRIDEIPQGTFINQRNLKKLLIMNNGLVNLNGNLFEGLSSLSMLYLQNNYLSNLDAEIFNETVNLKFLDLSRNHLMLLDNFPSSSSLIELNLEGNNINILRNDTFIGVPNLKYLNLERNKLSEIHSYAFFPVEHLYELDLSHNKLKFLPNSIFSPLKELEKLFLSYNPLQQVEPELFKGFSQLASLALEDIDIPNVSEGLFSQPKLKFLYLSKFHYCGFAPNVPICSPKTDGVSTSADLLGRNTLRAIVWIVGILTVVCNLTVLWGRITSRDEQGTLTVVIKNLAVSDALMGIYLIIIGIKDIEFRGEFHKVIRSWESSWLCVLSGILALLSAEVSTLFLCFLSFERFILIVAPLQSRPLSNKMAVYCTVLIWIIGFSIALFPVAIWRNSSKFYGSNSMCFPLHLDNPYFEGWQYSTMLFLGLNFSGILMLGILYIGMFISIIKTRRATTIPSTEIEIALRFFFIVATNAACWFPVAVLKLLALIRVPVSGDLYAWITVLFIPVNSTINPLLYTATVPRYREIIWKSLTNIPLFKKLSKINVVGTSTDTASVSARYKVAFSSGNLDEDIIAVNSEHKESLTSKITLSSWEEI